MDGKQRATREPEKQYRRCMILDTTAQLLDERAYTAITMAEVADRAGLAKGTVYLYFPTKEALFLALQERMLAAWFADLDAALAQLGPASAAAVAETICRSLAPRPHLTRLLAILHSVLEQNIDYETAVGFKQMLLAHMQRTGALLEHCLLFLRPGQGALVLLRAHALVIGLQHVSDPPPLVRQVLEQPELQVFHIDFAGELSATLRALLRGMECAPGDDAAPQS
jgi:AcrR family transcriptional regulator